MKTPLAWLQLSHQKMRLLIALAGIGFADILMFMQLGFQDALFESSVTFHRKVKGDIFLMSPKSTALIAMNSFSQRRLYQSLGVEGVEGVDPIYIGFALWKNPLTKKTRSIMAIGVNPANNIFDIPEVEQNLKKTQLEDVVLFDTLSRPEFGPITELFNKGKLETETGGVRITVGGLFPMGASFGADGNLITSDLNFLRLFKERDKGLIDMGVIHLKPGADPEAVRNQLDELLPEDVLVLSKQQFIEVERKYWETSTAIGFIFSLGVGMGFIVGIVIVYQILYTDVADHLPEYATLKAMGYNDWYLLGVVFQEAFLLAFIGYGPGITISTVLYYLTRNATSLPVAMDISKGVTVLVLTLIMCFVSGAIAVRKLSAADPADIF